MPPFAKSYSLRQNVLIGLLVLGLLLLALGYIEDYQSDEAAKGRVVQVTLKTLFRLIKKKPHANLRGEDSKHR